MVSPPLQITSGSRGSLSLTFRYLPLVLRPVAYPSVAQVFEAGWIMARAQLLSEYP